MNIQISPISMILVTPFYALCLFVLNRLWRKLKASPWRWGLPPLIPVLALLPFADEFWIAWHFEQACKEAGVHVYRQVKVEGFVDDTSRTPRNQVKTGNLNFDAKSLADWDMRGYRFQENMLTDGGVAHLERTPEGIVATILDQPTARYYIRYAYQPTPYRIEEPIGWRLEKIERQIVDSTTGEVLGRDTSIKRRAGTIDRSWVRLLGSDLTMCPDPSKGPKQPSFPEAVLMPVVQR